MKKILPFGLAIALLGVTLVKTPEAPTQLPLSTPTAAPTVNMASPGYTKKTIKIYSIPKMTGKVRGTLNADAQNETEILEAFWANDEYWGKIGTGMYIQLRFVY